MNNINPCLSARAKVAAGWAMIHEIPDTLRKEIEAMDPVALQIEREWDGKYSIVPSGDTVVVVPDVEHLRGFLEAAFGMSVRVTDDCVEMFTWQELFEQIPKPSPTTKPSPEDSYW